MPALTIPQSSSTVKVTLMDNGARIRGPMNFFLEPPELLEGLINLPDEVTPSAPAFSFLVEHESSGRRVVFDLGIRKTYEEYTPFVREYHKFFRWETGEKEISELLADKGVDLDSIEAVIWSHHHIDHIGNPTGFTPTTDLIVGPGFKETVLPGYPTNPKALVNESDIEGRNLRQLNFDAESGGLEIGGFRALDYFGDGSFYLLETPGHTIDHLAGLARTTASRTTTDNKNNDDDDPSPSSSSSSSPPQPTRSKFLLMGADLAHHPSQFRPSARLPLPASVSFASNPQAMRLAEHLRLKLDVCGCCCPSHVLAAATGMHGCATAPVHGVRAGHPKDARQAQGAVDAVREVWDCDEDVWVVMAHDYTVMSVLGGRGYDGDDDDGKGRESDEGEQRETMGRKGEGRLVGMNGWENEGWRENCRWAFLADFLHLSAGQGSLGETQEE